MNGPLLVLLLDPFLIYFFFLLPRICIFKSSRRPKFTDFLVVLLFEGMHAVGMALLAFVVLPELDVVKGAMLTNCLAFIPSVFGMYLLLNYNIILSFIVGLFMEL